MITYSIINHCQLFWIFDLKWTFPSTNANSSPSLKTLYRKFLFPISPKWTQLPWKNGILFQRWSIPMLSILDKFKYILIHYPHPHKVSMHLSMIETGTNLQSTSIAQKNRAPKTALILVDSTPAKQWVENEQGLLFRCRWISKNHHFIIHQDNQKKWVSKKIKTWWQLYLCSQSWKNCSIHSAIINLNWRREKLVGNLIIQTQWDIPVEMFIALLSHINSLIL